MLGAVAWATDGMGHANASGDAAVAPGYDPSITTDATSTCVGGVAAAMVGSPVHPSIGSGIADIIGSSMTSEGNP